MKNLLKNREYPLEERMFFFIYLTIMLSALMIIVMNLVTGLPMVNNVKWLLFIIFIIIVANFYKKIAD